MTSEDPLLLLASELTHFICYSDYTGCLTGAAESACLSLLRPNFNTRCCMWDGHENYRNTNMGEKHKHGWETQRAWMISYMYLCCEINKVWILLWFQISYEDDLFSDTVAPIEVEEMDIYTKAEQTGIDIRLAKKKTVSGM